MSLEAAARVFYDRWRAVDPELQLNFVKHVINNQRLATVVGIPGLAVERLEHLLARRLDGPHVQARRAFPRRRTNSQPHPRRPRPAQQPVPAGHRRCCCRRRHERSILLLFLRLLYVRTRIPGPLKRDGIGSGRGVKESGESREGDAWRPHAPRGRRQEKSSRIWISGGCLEATNAGKRRRKYICGCDNWWLPMLAQVISWRDFLPAS